MRIRFPIAAAFGLLLFGFAYLGLVPTSNPTGINDKVLHFVAFFLLTLALYWSLDLPRRLLLKLTLLASVGLDVGSEILQYLVNSGRIFDPYDIVANVAGSGLALALCAWYHRRMLERKRRRKMQGYGLVAGAETEDDLELGEGGSGEQALGMVHDDEDDDGAEAWDDIGGTDPIDSQKDDKNAVG